jgi:hypothetical protein
MGGIFSVTKKINSCEAVQDHVDILKKLKEHSERTSLKKKLKQEKK